MRHISKTGILVFAVAIGAAAATAGCASAPPLHTEASTSGIRAAEEVGAPRVPRAALHLQLAKEELEHAKGLAAEGEKAKAASMLTRAEADAQLAVALSRESNEQAEARSAIERVRRLRADSE
ncbi:MAG: DUF4398 domain-containing protein [Proteobacteria bacterium]|nr:DUF4398 domain-containing protein [Pseudomonadota bacterium]